MSRLFSLPRLLAVTLATALLAACSPRQHSREDEILRLFSDIDSLRTHGRYDAAVGVAHRLESLASGPGTRTWEAEDARRLQATLAKITTLSPAGRRDVALADSLTPVIERLMRVDEDHVAALSNASHQLELRSRRLGPTHPDVGASLDVMGQIANQAGEIERCEEYLQAALAIRRAQLGPRHPLVGETLLQWGILLKTRMELPRAAAAELEALAILESAYPNGDTHVALPLEALGSLYRLWKRDAPEIAERYYRRALEIRRHFGPRSVGVAENLTWLAYAHMFAGRLGPAEKASWEARDILHQHGMDFSNDMGDVMFNLGSIAWLRDDTAHAVEFWQQFAACQTYMPGSMPQGFGLARLSGLFPEWIDALLCQGQFAAAWQMVCRDSGPATRSLLNLSAARRRWRVDADRLDSLRAEVFALRRTVNSHPALLHAPLGGVQPGSDLWTQLAVEDSFRVRLARTDAERMLLEQILVRRISGADGGSTPTLEEIQARLAPDQAMIGWIHGKWGNDKLWKGTLWAYVVRHTGPAQWIHIGAWRVGEEVTLWRRSSERVLRMMIRSSQWPHRVAADAELASLSNDAWRKVFQPLMSNLHGVRELIVVDGRTIPGWLVPILPECLVDDQGDPLITRFAFSYVPSPDAFVRLADEANRNPRQYRSIIAVADPLGPPKSPSEAANLTLAESPLARSDDMIGATLVSPSLFRGALAGDPDAIRRLPQLPDSRREALAVASLFRKSKVLMGPEATRTALESDLLRAGPLGVLHLATHALVDEKLPARSLLVLSTGRAAARDSMGSESLDDTSITAGEILLGRQFDIDLVTLSGCQTYQGLPARGGEDLGFAQSFLAAGARCLLMSRWKVEDRATSLLMERFYENMTGTFRDRRAGVVGIPMSKARALQEAQIWLKNWQAPDGTTPFAHPIYWAGFVLIGAAACPSPG